VHAGQTVIEASPYHYIRHPAYAGALITVIGLGLTLGNWASLFATLACVSV
jgi:protein-S-isoprenylcysteine O-methyltransferase Ste14